MGNISGWLMESFMAREEQALGTQHPKLLRQYTTKSLWSELSQSTSFEISRSCEGSEISDYDDLEAEDRDGENLNASPSLERHRLPLATVSGLRDSFRIGTWDFGSQGRGQREDGAAGFRV